MRGLALVATFVAVDACGRVGFDARLADDALADGSPDAFPADLVAYYPMDHVANLSIIDVAHHHDAACGPCPTPTTGQIGQALTFDGVTELAQAPSATDLELTTGFTVTAFANIPAAPTLRACIATKGLGAGIRNSWAVCIEPSLEIYFFTSTSAGVDDQFSTSLTTVNAWHHVAIRWDGTTKTVFLDGTSEGSKAASVEFDTQTVRIGGDFDNSALSALFPGSIDELRIYSRALDDNEIFALAQP